MIRSYLEKRRTRKTLQKYLSAEGIEAIMKGKLDKGFGRLEPASMELVIAAVDGPTPEIVSERMGQVTDIAVKHGGVVVTLISSIVIVAFGIAPLQQDSSSNRFTLVNELSAQLLGNIKIIHGTRTGVYGNVGNSRRMSYGFIVSGFVETMGLLADMEFGETKDISRDA